MKNPLKPPLLVETDELEPLGVAAIALMVVVLTVVVLTVVVVFMVVVLTVVVDLMVEVVVLVVVTVLAETTFATALTLAVFETTKLVETVFVDPFADKALPETPFDGVEAKASVPEKSAIINMATKPALSESILLPLIL